ncbi:MAG: T9SS type A sorting domain-containing protein [Candidatus Cloacimonadaceae bacterium]
MKKMITIVFSLLLPIMVFGAVFGLKSPVTLKLNPSFLSQTIHVPQSIDLFQKDVGESEWIQVDKVTYEYLPYQGSRPRIKHVYNYLDIEGEWIPALRGDFEYNTSQLCTEFVIGFVADDDELIPLMSGTVEYDAQDRLTKYEMITAFDGDGEVLNRIEIEYFSDYDMDIYVFFQDGDWIEYQQVEIELDSQNRMRSQTVISSYDGVNWQPDTKFTFAYHAQDTSTAVDFIRYLTDNIVMLMLMEGEMMYGMVTEYTESYWDGDIWRADEKHIYDYDSNLFKTAKKYYYFGDFKDSSSAKSWRHYYRDSYTYDAHGNMIEELGEQYQDGEYTDSFLAEVGYTMLTDNEDLTAPAVSPIDISIYPQPFAGNVNIFGESKAGGEIKIEIFNLRGQKVRGFNLPSGASFSWDGRDESGKELPASVYFLRAGQDSAFRTKKLIKIR